MLYRLKQDNDHEYLVDSEQYTKLYKQSVDDNETFRAEQALLLQSNKPISTIKDFSLWSK